MGIMDEQIEVEALEIADLEYDVGGVSSIEAATGRQTNDTVIVFFVTPN